MAIIKAGNMLITLIPMNYVQGGSKEKGTKEFCAVIYSTCSIPLDGASPFCADPSNRHSMQLSTPRFCTRWPACSSSFSSQSQTPNQELCNAGAALVLLTASSTHATALKDWGEVGHAWDP